MQFNVWGQMEGDNAVGLHPQSQDSLSVEFQDSKKCCRPVKWDLCRRHARRPIDYRRKQEQRLVNKLVDSWWGSAPVASTQRIIIIYFILAQFRTLDGRTVGCAQDGARPRSVRQHGAAGGAAGLRAAAACRLYSRLD